MRRASGPFLIEGCFIVDQKLVVFNEDGSTRKIGLHSAEVLIFYTPLQKKTKVPNVFDKKVNFYTPRPKKKTKVHNVFDEKKKGSQCQEMSPELTTGCAKYVSEKHPNANGQYCSTPTHHY